MLNSVSKLQICKILSYVYLQSLAISIHWTLVYRYIFFLLKIIGLVKWNYLIILDREITTALLSKTKQLKF